MFFAGAAEKRPSQAARGLHRRRLTSTVYRWNPPAPTIFLEINHKVRVGMHVWYAEFIFQKGESP